MKDKTNVTFRCVGQFLFLQEDTRVIRILNLNNIEDIRVMSQKEGEWWVVADFVNSRDEIKGLLCYSDSDTADCIVNEIARALAQ